MNKTGEMSEATVPVEKERDFIVFGAPLIGPDEIREVEDSLLSGWLGTGPKVARFEKDFAAYKDSPSDLAVAVSSCTAALHLSLVCLGLEPGDEVITTPLTFCATVNAIIHAGGTPVLADIDPETGNIDPAEIERKITPRTKAVLIVHFAGRPCEMDRILPLVEKHGLALIEDCAHAIETEYKGRKAGAFGEFGCFSFYATKNICTGEGGMILAKTAAQAQRCRILGLHGMDKDAWKRFSAEGYRHYQVVECGFKYNMMDLQAAIGLHQLRRIESFWARRRDLWAKYMAGLAGLPLRLPAPPEPGTRHSFHLFGVGVDEAATGVSRDALLERLTRKKIGVGVHYMSVPEHPVYQQKYGWKPADYPHAMKTGRETLSLPLFPKLSDETIDYVIHAVREILHS